ncbi:MAG: SRPBCC family protein [Longimicrobiales bacterium]|nr:SRPBCC family protein [Longimicrobiales bacterium]
MRLLRWLGAAVVLLLVAAAGIWIIGSLLPVEHRATVSRTVPADVEVVWQRIDRVDGWPTWRNVRVDMLSGDSVRVYDAWETLTYRIERPRPRTLVTEIVTAGLPFGGRWIWSVAPDDEGAVVTLVEEGEVYDPFFRFFSRFVFGHDSTMRSVLDELEASFEEGSAPDTP